MNSSQTETARVQGRHAGITRDQVLRVAVALIDTEGLAALSMRRLARELGVEAMTLYHHVKNKAALEDAVVEYVLTEAFAQLAPVGPWQQVVSSYAMALHRGLLAHPGAAVLFAQRPAMTPRNLEQLENLLDALTKAGFSSADALTIVRATAASVLGQHLSLDSDRPPLEVVDQSDLAGNVLTTRALEPGLPGIDAMVDFIVTALVAGYERLL